MREPGLADKVVQLHDALVAANVAHAFGGALALAYYAEPRATADVDINLFVGPSEFARILEVLEPFGIMRIPTSKQVQREGQARVWWGRTPLDLFFAYDEIHDAMRDRVRMVPFGEVEIPILAAEHLIVAKVVFDRPKDWLDIEQMLVTVPSLDLDDVARWLRHLLEIDDQRITRFEALVSRILNR
ncbi:MAG: hypothetical protein QOC92_2212 [Acidimicrobiaceae bacterium]|jgi:hypothetical protein